MQDHEKECDDSLTHGGPAKQRAEPAQAVEEVIDYRRKSVPSWVQEAIATSMAMEQETAKEANAIGYMARALVSAAMPYKDPKTDVFTRQNGSLKLRILAGYEGGIPYGIYPRMLTSWLSTEAVRTRSRDIELGDSLRKHLVQVLDVKSVSGGKRGTGTRATDQMKRLFGATITVQGEEANESKVIDPKTLDIRSRKKFRLKNISIADEVEIDDEDAAAFDGEDDDQLLWTPQASEHAGQWRSHVRLSTNFFNELITNPVPIDLRAYHFLRRSGPLSMDIYAWLTYRLSYTHRKTRPIRWEALMMQFGSNVRINANDPGQAVRDFRNKMFLPALRAVLDLYPQAKVQIEDKGLVLLPSQPHVPKVSIYVPDSAPPPPPPSRKSPEQPDLF